jgi:AcrR family transcriptional regulator
MPRIEAASIAKHIEQQTDRLLDVASVLFKTRGYRQTDMGLIAAEMGLARSSLYRYYPNKDHVLLECIKRDMTPLLADFAALTERYSDPFERVDAWLDMQIDAATSPDHAGLELMNELRHADHELQEQIMVLHRQPTQILEGALAAIDHLSAIEITVLAKMITGMVHAAALHMIDHSSADLHSEQGVREQLKQAVRQVLRSSEHEPI